MTALGVRRDKAALSPWVESLSAIAPAESNRSNYGGHEMVEVSGEACHKIKVTEGFNFTQFDHFKSLCHFYFAIKLINILLRRQLLGLEFYEKS
ncbi:MAG: hypothetical protein V4660_06120 [Pseudomonadota bacterium]